MNTFLSCAQDMWHPTLGDPTMGGLGLTALYLLASLAFLYTVFRSRDWLPSERLLWGVSTAILVAVTLNKQLDLQHYMNLVGRCVAHRESWEAERIDAQRVLGLSILALGVAGAVWLFRRCGAALAANRPLILGFVLMGAFIALEVARFEALLGNLGEYIERLRLHRMLETVALLALIRAAWLRVRKPG